MPRTALDQASPGTSDFSTFVQTQWTSLNRFAYATTGNAEDAADALQQALASVWPHWAQIRTGNPGAYLRRAIVNAHITNCRRTNRTQARDDLDQWAHPLAPDALARLSDADLAGRLCAGLPPRQRTAIVLRYLEDLSYVEIASILETTQVNARALVHNALATLRAQLPERI